MTREEADSFFYFITGKPTIMSRDFTFEPEIAQKTEFKRQYIDQSGVYIGKFTSAWYEQSPSGAECIKLRFVAEDGSQANNLSVYTHRGNGEKLPGYSLIQKIMACMKVRTLNARPDNIDIFDYHSKKMIKQKRDVYPMLYGSIGLVLTTEEYQTQWKIKKQVIIRAAFDPQSRLMADEILEGITEPATQDKLIAHLDVKNEWHKTPKAHNSVSTSSPKQTQPAQNQRQTSTQNDDPFEEDHVPLLPIQKIQAAFFRYFYLIYNCLY